MSTTGIILAACVAGAGYSAVVIALGAMVRKVSVGQRVIIIVILLLPILAVSFLQPLRTGLGYSGRIASLVSFGVVFSILQKVKSNRKNKSEDTEQTN